MKTYLTRDKIAAITGRKREWIRQFVNGMKKSGRYKEDDVIQDGHLVLVSADAFTDWLRYRKKIEHGELVAPYGRNDDYDKE